MKSHLQNSIELIRKHFSTNWWINNGFDKTVVEDDTLLTRIKTFQNETNKSLDEIFDDLNISILDGEYCGDKDFEANLLTLEKLLVTAEKEMVGGGNQIEVEQISLDLKKNFFAILKSAIGHYSLFFSQVKNKLLISNKRYILSYHEEVLKSESNTNGNLKFLRTNIFVAWCDHFMDIESNNNIQLFKFSRSLDDLIPKFYTASLKAKCKFLIAKILLRKKKESEIPTYVLINSDEHDLDINSFDVDGIFREEFEYIETHYQIKNEWENCISRDFDRIKHKPLGDLNVRELHRLIKYHKDISKSIDALKLIEEEFKKRLFTSKEKGNRFDFYTYSIALNYCLNNEFSFLCESDETSEEQFEKLYNEIIALQSSSGIRNFFPQLKYLKFYLNKLKKIYSDNKALDLIEICKELIKKCEDSIPMYEKNVQWSVNNYNYVFQLPFEECLIDTKSEDVPKLFIFSSFLMPLPKDKYIQEFEKLKFEVNDYSASISVYTNVNNEIIAFKNIKEELKETRKKLEKGEVRTMEVLGVFTAIISFLAGSISGFKFIQTGQQAVLFMLSLATSLSFFVFLLISFFRGNDEYEKNKKNIGRLFVVTSISWLSLVCFIYILPQQPKQNIDKCDSINNRNAIINSNNSIVIKTCDTCKNQLKNPPKPPTVTKVKIVKVKECPHCPNLDSNKTMK